MDCKNCVKEDVCIQKDIFRKLKKTLENTFIDGDSMKTIAMTKGITVEINCNRAIKKQTEFSPGWTNANTKKL